MSVPDFAEEAYFGTFQTEGEAKMRLAQVLEEAFDEQGIESSEVRGQIEAAMRNGYYHFREHGKVTSWFMVEGE